MMRTTIKLPRQDKRLGLSPTAWLFLGAAALLVLWELAPRVGLIDSFSIPPFSTVLVHLGRLLADGSFWTEHLLTTLRAVGIAFLIASAAGVLIGVLTWLNPWLRKILDPWLAIYYAIPTFALYPMLVVMIGIGETPVIVLGVLLAIVTVIVSTVNGLDSTNPAILTLARSLQLSRFELIRKVLIPSSLGQIMVGLRLAISYSFIAVIASEFILSVRGIGYFISRAFNDFAIANMYAGILLIVIVALTVNYGFGSIVNRRERRISG